LPACLAERAWLAVGARVGRLARERTELAGRALGAGVRIQAHYCAPLACGTVCTGGSGGLACECVELARSAIGANHIPRRYF